MEGVFGEEKAVRQGRADKTDTNTLCDAGVSLTNEEMKIVVLSC
jgi:hypothetical protein